MQTSTSSFVKEFGYVRTYVHTCMKMQKSVCTFLIFLSLAEIHRYVREIDALEISDSNSTYIRTYVYT